MARGALISEDKLAVMSKVVVIRELLKSTKNNFFEKLVSGVQKADWAIAVLGFYLFSN